MQQRFGVDVVNLRNGERGQLSIYVDSVESVWFCFASGAKLELRSLFPYWRKKNRCQSVFCCVPRLWYHRTSYFACCDTESCTLLSALSVQFFFFSLAHSGLRIFLSSNDNSVWMSRVDGHKELKQIFFPATHNSAASKEVMFHACPSVKKSFALATHVIGGVGCLKNFVSQFTLTQHLSVWHQLMIGVRGLDFRIAMMPMGDTDREEGLFFVSHTFSLGPLFFFMGQIVDFLRSHPSEVCVVVLKPDWPHREAVKKNAPLLLKKLQNFLGDLFYDGRTPLQCLNDVRQCGQRCICVLLECDMNTLEEEERNFVLSPFFSLLDWHWANTNQMTSLRESIEMRLFSLPPPSAGWIREAAYILTPRTSEILQSAVKSGGSEGSTLQRWAREANDMLREHMRMIDRCHCNYFSMDYADPLTVDAVVKKNA